MIPKIIHYCWFGGNPLPELVQKCIESWKQYCPDYEIIEWNESNFDVNYCNYVREAYTAGKWAFVSDVARLYALVNYGGIYMDTDVELLRPLDKLLEYEAVSGFETKDRIQTAFMACQKGQPFFAELLHDYNNACFVREDGTNNTSTNVTRITHKLLEYGLRLDNTMQTVNGLTLLPYDYLCPKNFDTKILTVTDNTVVIHHFDGSWLPEVNRLAMKLHGKYSRFLPTRLAELLAKFVAMVNYDGLRVAIREVIRWIRNG